MFEAQPIIDELDSISEKTKYPSQIKLKLIPVN
jgi:hypothetical protein